MKAIWSYLDGKKTIISALAGLALSWAQAKGYVTGDNATYLASGLTMITGVAVGHKLVKAAKDEPPTA